jgi:D-beta-D-heptose 7-phosphate kinase / D-beta-D-heptose 1-phosphate adenosyltransferase
VSFDNPETVLHALETAFGRRSVLVAGDLMLDRYLWGDVGRISPEAPVPVVRLTRRTENAGGAANVALNLAGLGCKVRVIGFIGRDDAGRALIELLKKSDIDTSGIIETAGRPTITKTRVIGLRQQLARIDEEESGPPSEGDAARLLTAARMALASGPTAAVLSDYAKGALSVRFCREIIADARRRGLPVLIDPKGRDFDKYAGATTVTPNQSELAAALGEAPEKIDALLAGGARLRERLGLDFLTFTRGEHGITILEKSGAVSHFPAVAREVFDVSGAGDTVIAALAAGLAAGLALHDAVRLADQAAGIVVGKVGTVPINRAELLDAVMGRSLLPASNKIVDRAELAQWVAAWRERGEKVVFTNGCFDILHAGHVAMLERARQEGGRLVVGLNTDESVRRLKGPGRPINHEQDRAAVLAGLACVDAVAFFDEDTPLELIKAVRPDVLAKGADYTEATVVGAAEVKSWGGRVALVPLTDGKSTSKTIEKIRSADRAGPDKT